MKTLAAIVLAWICLAAAGDGPKPDELLGKWNPRDPNFGPVVFEKDGRFQYSWEKKPDGEWRLVPGTYTIEADGRIVTRVEHAGVVLGVWFRYENGLLRKPYGMGKTASWEREKKHDVAGTGHEQLED